MRNEDELAASGQAHASDEDSGRLTAFNQMRVGVFDFAWVRVSLGSMFLMGLLGGPVVRSQMRALLHAGPDDGRRTSARLRRHASHPLLRASLRTRVAVGLAIIYLMIRKPDLGESLLPIGASLVLGAVMSVPQWRAQPDEQVIRTQSPPAR